MAPLVPIILAALAGFTLGAIVVVLILKWKDIINWFRNRQKLKESDKANIAFTLQERLKNGNYKTIKGIFNKRTDEILDAEAVKSERIDNKLAKAHEDNDLVIYE